MASVTPVTNEKGAAAGALVLEDSLSYIAPMTGSADPFRAAALTLLDLPVDERTAAFCRLLDEWVPIEIAKARANGDGRELIDRTTQMWAVGAEIGVMAPPKLE